VRWDRVAGEATDGRIAVFGWMDRSDGRHDFVVLDLNFPSPELPQGGVGYTTSSAKLSAKIGELLYGAENVEHFPCRRVEHEFPGLVENVVHLT
jgi:hypothetical protein